MIGHLSPRYRSFGWAAARFDDVLNLVPARLSGLLIAIAAAVTPPREQRRRAARHAARCRKAPLANAGWPEGAMAGALGLALAGPRRYADRVVDDPWVGDGRARVTPTDMHRALLVYAIACALQGAAILGLYLVLRAR